MRSLIKRFPAVIYGAVLGFMVATPAAADDTEIYLGSDNGLSDSPANVLFVIDTSGSMDFDSGEQEDATKAAYDPSQTYAGSYDTSRIYYADLPANITTSKYFAESRLVCDHAKADLGNLGKYNSGAQKLAMWTKVTNSNYDWKNISTNTSYYVECEADKGVHGKTSSSSLRYAADTGGSTGGWSSTSTTFAWGQPQVLYTGNYANYVNSPPGTMVDISRLRSVQYAVKDIISSMGASTTKIGLMQFDRGADGGMVIEALDAVANNESQFLDGIDKLIAQNATPLSTTMFEAASYYRGAAVAYGNTSERCVIDGGSNSCDLAESFPSVDKARKTPGGDYQSPITLQCQKNFIIFLTDGDPNGDGTPAITNIGMTGNCSDVGAGLTYETNCMDDIAGYLAGVDQIDNAVLPGEQIISTYTIGFGSGITPNGTALLESAAAASKAASGYGEYFPATNSLGVVAAVTNIFNDIAATNNTFSSPAISVNAFNKTYHEDALYFSLFKPSLGAHWDGNFKRYRLDFDVNHNPVIKDRDNQPAIYSGTDPAKAGYFDDGARSYWSDSTDGPLVVLGGAAHKLSNTRKVYTYTGTTKDLTASSNLLHEVNSDVTDTMLSVVDGADADTDTVNERANLLKWARGIDVDDAQGINTAGNAIGSNGQTTDARLVMGDPLHGEPALVTYGGSATDPDITIYVPTNDGYLHAFTVSNNTGTFDVNSSVTETFAFVPPQLLPNLNLLYEDDGSTKKAYGLDGSITAWVQDLDKDGVIEPGDGDTVYIYFGMRRGGKQYYALDVTNRNKPEMMWTITGGAGNFAELSQTWSQPVMAKLRVAGVDKHVLVFAGGYDPDQDNAVTRTNDDIGRAVYIVDAKTGDRLWWASSLNGADLKLTEMEYSMPSTVSVIDADSDGYADKLFVGDMGGQIFRFDIARNESGASTLPSQIKGGRIAEFAADGSEADARRFYYPPSVSLVKDGSNQIKLALSITSGYREHPLLNTNADRIYAITTSPVKSAPTSYTTMTEADLYDTTSNIIREGDAAEQSAAKDALSAASGWYIKMEDVGEKGLSKTLIAANMLFVTTYLPKDSTNTAQVCSPSEGGGKTYVLSLADGGAAFINAGDTKAARNLWLLEKAGIPADPKTIYTDNKNQDDMAVCVGTECIQADKTNKHEKLYWLAR